MTTPAPLAGLAALPDVAGDPYAAGEIASELRRIQAASASYWAAYDTPSFFHRPQPDVWAPVDQVRHLTKSVGAVAKGMQVPKLLLLLRFGWTGRRSQRLEVLRASYRTRLAGGAKAGRFAPRPLDATERGDEARARFMAQHEQSVNALADATERWPDWALDHLMMPHPVLGKLTVREMLLFTVLHNVHHVHVAERRRVEHAGA